MRKLIGAVVVGLWMTASALAADVDMLIKQLKSPDVDTRRAAAQSLAEAGEEAKPAVGALVKALREDKDRFVRRFAAEALGQIGAGPAAVLPALRQALSDPKKEVQEAAATALGKMGKDAVNLLAAAVKDASREAEVRRKSAEALGAMGADARPALKVLLEVLKVAPPGRPNDADIRVEVVVAVGKIASEDDKDAVAAVTALTDKKNRNRSLMSAANQALKSIKNNK
jgi:HEAT repeat protein